MGGLAHYLEAAGLATTQISLVREHTEKMRPPRALWVPFELGRPFGPPRDAAFQTRVLRAALALFERAEGPVLEDYPEEMPDAASAAEDWVCPVSFSAPRAALSGDAAVAAAFRDEHGALASWYDRAVERHGRTSVGLSGLEVDALGELFCELLLNGPGTLPASEHAPADLVRFAAEDLKAYYLESAATQPGSPGSQKLARWFWRDTAAAELLRALRARFVAMDDPAFKLLGQLLLVPRLADELAAPASD